MTPEHKALPSLCWHPRIPREGPDCYLESQYAAQFVQIHSVQNHGINKHTHGIKKKKKKKGKKKKQQEKKKKKKGNCEI